MLVRSIYDADAVLRRAAAVLRTLSASDAVAAPPLDPGRSARTFDATVPGRAPLRNRRVTFVAALRRSREVLEALHRTLIMRPTLAQARRAAATADESQ